MVGLGNTISYAGGGAGYIRLSPKFGHRRGFDDRGPTEWEGVQPGDTLYTRRLMDLESRNRAELSRPKARVKPPPKPKGLARAVPVLCVETGEAFRSAAAAARAIGCHPNLVKLACTGRGRTPTAKGRHWRRITLEEFNRLEQGREDREIAGPYALPAGADGAVRGGGAGAAVPDAQAA